MWQRYEEDDTKIVRRRHGDSQSTYDNQYLLPSNLDLVQRVMDEACSRDGNGSTFDSWLAEVVWRIDIAFTHGHTILG